MITAAGPGGPLCGHCGRPMLAGVTIGGVMYHEECTRGPGWQPPAFQPLPQLDHWHPMWTAPALTEADVRRIVREELAAANGAAPMTAVEG